MGLSIQDSHFHRRRRGSQSGQGVIEYILMMVVAIVLIFGITYQFNDAFRVWGQNYFGDYTACLLETGELPAVGGTGGSSSACADIFKPFNLADGRAYVGPGGGIGGGGGGGDDDDGGTGDDGNDKNKTGGTGEGGSSAGYTSSNKKSGDGFGSNNRFGANNSGANSGGGAGRTRKAYTGSTEDSLAGSLGSGSRSSSSRKRQSLETGFYIARDSRPDEQIERAPAKISEGTRTERTTRMIVKKRPKSSDGVQADTPMTFGDYFRYLLIAAIIIALIVVVGGQLSQVSSED